MWKTASRYFKCTTLYRLTCGLSLWEWTIELFKLHSRRESQERRRRKRLVFHIFSAYLALLLFHRGIIFSLFRIRKRLDVSFNGETCQLEVSWRWLSTSTYFKVVSVAARTSRERDTRTLLLSLSLSLSTIYMYISIHFFFISSAWVESVSYWVYCTGEVVCVVLAVVSRGTKVHVRVRVRVRVRVKFRKSKATLSRKK